MSCARPGGRTLFWTAVLAATATCTKLPYEPVQILVLEVETQGSELDEDGYVATIDDDMSRPVAANGSATFEGVGAGERLLTISGLAANCAVEGPNPRPLSIEEDAVTRARLRVNCSAVGLLVVEVGTTGTTPDPDGYTVSVDESTPRTVGTNGAVTFDGLAPGEHEVALANIADNCAVLDEEANPRVVTVEAEVSVTTTFQVQCGPRGGDLVVVAATSGTDVDPDGYSISLNDESSKPIEINGAVTFTNLPEGEYEVAIDGLANNCSLSEGSRLRTVTVSPNTSAAETFFVFCGPPAGTLVVDVTTTGTDVDADGYTVSVGDTRSASLTTNGSATFEGLAAGDYLVELTGIAPNCRIVVDETPNPRLITLTAGASSATSFFVHCEPVAGALVVDITTEGAPESEGYTVFAEDATRGVGPNGAVLFEELLAGDWTVGVRTVGPDCIVDGPHPRRVRIVAGASTRTSLSVFCDETRDGTILVEVTTSGPDPDLDGYGITLDGGDPVRVTPTGSAAFRRLAPGPHTVRIDGLAENCQVDGTRRRDVEVGSGGPVVVRFDVVCERRDTRATGSLQVKARVSGEDLDPDGFLITVDGGSPRPVATNGSVTFTDLVPGEHTVRLDGMAPNCSLEGHASRVVDITAGTTLVFRFFVDCRAIS